ncbi:hypothetical protein BBJ28_00001644 [Nothophytophthora sp. Chile5]|nr:hypothetical protein BBJ28_00001644 [Nothophytophthora sp. Chile5]
MRRVPPLAASATRRCFSTQRLDAAYRKLLEVGDAEHMQITDAQTRAVALATRGFSVFLHLPTGAGKSLAFQTPALLAPADQTTLVVSPLIALMHDQVAALRRKGVDAIQVSSDERRKSVPLTQLLARQRLVYTTPEFLLLNSEMREWMRMAGRENRLARIVLDEAHCVLEWGNTFRPSYLELSQWKTQFFGSVPLTLATASVSDEDIARLAALFHLKLLHSVPETSKEDEGEGSQASTRSDQLVVIQQVTDRENLRVEVVRKTALAAERIAERVQQATTIVYCLTRKEAEETCLALVRLGCHTGVYHGGLPRKRREFVRKQWMMGQLSIICATSAFGPAVCVLLYSEADKSRADALTTERSDFNGTMAASISNGSSHVELEEVAAFCETTTGCRKELLYSHFGFNFDASRCIRNCNCGVPLEAAESWRDEAVHVEKPSTDEDGISKGAIEYQYQRILVESKRLKLPKREALSRRLIRVRQNPLCT